MTKRQTLEHFSYSQNKLTADSITVIYISADEYLQLLKVHSTHPKQQQQFIDINNEIKNGDSCTVFAEYKISSKGKLVSVKIIKGNQNPELNKQAIDVIKNQKLWENYTGFQFVFFQPITFKEPICQIKVKR